MSTSSPIRILLVDDHPLFRAGVAAVLRADPAFAVCAETASGAEARGLALAQQPDMAVVDLLLGEDDGLRLVRELRRELPQLRIVVLSMLDEATYQPRALAAGADAFLSKRDGPESIVAALKLVAAKPRSHVRPPAGTASEIDTLSERELQVFRELGLGRSTQEIAAALGVSVKTVESHREGIKLKLGLPHSNALVARAALWVREQGLAR